VRGISRRPAERAAMRTMFVVYLVVIVAGVSLWIAVGVLDA
jgi:hypothetical protein